MGRRIIKNLQVFGASLLVNTAEEVAADEIPFLPERWSSSLETICLASAYLIWRVVVSHVQRGQAKANKS